MDMLLRVFFFFFWLLGFNGASSQQRWWSSYCVRRGAAVTPPFIEVLRPFKAGRSGVRKLLQGGCSQSLPPVHRSVSWLACAKSDKYATLWSVARLKAWKKIATAENKQPGGFYKKKLRALHASRAFRTPDAHMRPWACGRRLCDLIACTHLPRIAHNTTQKFIVVLFFFPLKQPR